MLKNLKSDIARYVKDPNDPRNIYLIFEQGLWAIAVYRLGQAVRKVRIPIIGWLLRLIVFLMFKNIEIFTGVSLPATAKIGKGFYVGHFGFIILHSDAELGENCSVGPGVVIGTRGQGNTGVPKIGNNVYIGVGAKVLGGITVGDNACIGANAVVVKDVPAGATVVGIPAREICSKGQDQC